MGQANIRKPIQKRSIETKEKILKAGFKLICEKGYYNTNTAEIAKAANVSTGIIYQYFKDKHDVLIEGLQAYSDLTFFPLLDPLKDNLKKENLEFILKDIINTILKKHTIPYAVHNEFAALTLSDNEVDEIYKNFEINLTDKITDILIQNNFKIENIREKVHLVIHLVDTLCHEICYHKHDSINYDVMTDETVKIIVNLLK